MLLHWHCTELDWVAAKDGDFAFSCTSFNTHLSGITIEGEIRTETRRSLKVTMADHNEPHGVKMQIGIMREKLKEAMPVLVQEFNWEKAELILLDRLFNLVQEAVKWSLILFFTFSSVSDIVYTFSINRELIIPVALFVGCLVTDFLKEISQELFHRTEEKDLKWHFLGMYCFFVFVKLMSTWCAMLPQVFLLHVANGGLMQVLWHWRKFMEDSNNKQETSSPSSLGASL
ncbi:hypothetical protein Fmac_031753 [Flemingia macrophylla]|uniref:Uncharacterized protein n=1 Tax=Flemingia macrophylla TaxID=520843 RepID=A0ABD1L2Y4_9FABA